MPTIHTGQQVLVHTCGVIMRGIVQRIQPTPWGEPCYLIRGQWYSQAVHPDPSLKVRSQWFLDKLYTEPSDPPVLLVRDKGEEKSSYQKQLRFLILYRVLMQVLRNWLTWQKR